MKHLNLGILAHVDAGKTSLTERLLYTTGVINRIGSVDDGNTQTDTMALERQRGITIRAAVVSFVIGDVTVNLIDTPGHPDFIAEVERALSVLDGVVLVVSAVEGVQAQTRVLMRTLQRLRIPTLIFVNKIDRSGAQRETLLHRIRERLAPSIIAMTATDELGSRAADAQPYDLCDPAFRMALVDQLAAHDDALLAAYVEDEAAITPQQLWDALAEQTARMDVHPVFFGSAITGAGVGALLDAIPTLLPARIGDPDAPMSGSVFKIERGAAGEKIAYVRMYAGTLHARERVRFGADQEGKVIGLGVFERGTAVQRPSVAAGQIGKVWGLADVQIGDTIGVSPTHDQRHYFAPPTLETMVVPRSPADRTALHTALQRLAEQDPLINLRRDEAQQELFVSLYGEVQKEVIQDTLRVEHNLEVEFSASTIICVERVCGTGESVDVMGKGMNPFLATIGLRVESAPLGSGIQLTLDVDVESTPRFIYKSIDEFQATMRDTIEDVLQQGLSGWQIPDCNVTMTQSGYISPSSSAKDFRLLTPLVLMDALKQAGTEVCEPMHHFWLDVPADLFGPLLPALARVRAVPSAPSMRDNVFVVEGVIPAANVHELQQQLPGLTRGEGVFETAFERYDPIEGEAPTRARTDLNPLNRKEYLMNLGRHG